MRLLTILKHIGIILGSAAIVLGIPLWSAGGLHSLLSAEPDAVSSASVILDKPSGSYLVYINKELHPDPAKLNDWITFFRGGEILYIFEDVSCSVASSDAGGIALAESYRSQLPENQMKVTREDGTLLLSRADHGLFDILVMSREFAEAFHAETVLGDSVIVIEVRQEEAAQG